MAIFFTSDTHFGHANIINYCSRPFRNVDQMDDILIENWNSKVGAKDEVYHLGDFAMYGKGAAGYAINAAESLNGRIYLIKGNHDKRLFKGPHKARLEARFEWIKDYYELKVFDEETKQRQRIILSHYPFASWNGMHRGTWHLHGHCVDLDTQILTQSGWKYRSELKVGESIIVLKHQNGISEQKELSYDHIQEIIDLPHYSGQVYEHHSKSIDLRVTDNHTIIHFSRDGRYLYKTTSSDFFNRKRATVCHSGVLKKPGLAIKDPLLALYILLAADGNIKQDTYLARIRVKKPHKIAYIREILLWANIEWKEYISKGYTSFNFYLPQVLRQWNIKGLDTRLYDCNDHQFKIILEAYQASDGCKNGNGTIIYSAKEQEIDLLQALAVQSGFSATKHSCYNGFSIYKQHQLSVYPRQIAEVSTLDQAISTQVNNEHFWCIKCQNQNFFIRRNGKVHLTGNCHGNFPEDIRRKRIDVGVDCFGFVPMSYHDVKSVMAGRIFEAVDHHGDKE